MRKVKIKGWAIIDTETDDGQYTLKNQPYILFNYNSEGTPYLNVFDYRHERIAVASRNKWKKAYHPTARLVPCEIILHIKK